MSIVENLGNVVRDARENSGLSQRQLMEKMGFGKDSRTWISKIETGAIVPTLGPLEKLAAALGTRVSILITVAENYKPHAKVDPSIIAGLIRKPDNVTAMVAHPAAMAKRREIGRALGTLPKETQ